MINTIDAIRKAKIKVFFYNASHIRQWKSHVILENTLFIFWNKNKVYYIPFQNYGKSRKSNITKKDIRKKARIKKQSVEVQTEK